MSERKPAWIPEVQRWAALLFEEREIRLKCPKCGVIIARHRRKCPYAPLDEMRIALNDRRYGDVPPALIVAYWGDAIGPVGIWALRQLHERGSP